MHDPPSWTPPVADVSTAPDSATSITHRIGQIEATLATSRREHHPPAAITLLEDQLSYWQAVSRGKVGPGRSTSWKPEDFAVGDSVLLGRYWWAVLRVNKATVTVSTDRSQEHALYHRILAHRQARQTRETTK